MQRLIKPASILASLALVLAACSSGSATTAPTSAPTAGGATPTAAAPSGTAAAPSGTAAAGGLTGTLNLWDTYASGAGTEPDAFKATLAAVKAANPGLVLNVVEVGFGDLFKKYQLEAASGGGPDLFIAPNDSMGDLYRNGLSLDLTGKVPQSRLDATKPLAVSGSELDGKLVQVPESLKAVAMYYNADKVKTPPATTADLLAGVTAKTYTVGLFGGKDALYHNFGWWGAFGGKLIDDTGKCVADTTGVADAFKFIKDLKAAGVVFSPKYDDMANGFKTGKYDIIIDGPWAAGGYVDAVKNLGVAPMPAGPKGPSLPFTGVDGWTINPNTKNVDLAVNFALAMTDKAGQQTFADKAYHIPAEADIASTNAISKQFSDASDKGYPRPQSKEFGAFWTPFGAAMDTVDQGGDPTAAVAAACTQMNQANSK